MPKMIVSIDEVVIKEVHITKDRTTLGRRPYNDVVIDNLAVSGEHAVILMNGSDIFLEDLNSTNGTYVNGKAVKKQLLRHGDGIEVGKYKIKFMADGRDDPAEQALTSRGRPARANAQSLYSGTPNDANEFQGAGALNAAIKVLSGASSGRELPLTKVVTTIGKPGVAVAAITRKQQGFVVHHVEGSGNPTLNGASIGNDPAPLKNGDVVELAGTRMQFIQH